MKNKNKHGFTLVELLIVLAVIGIAASIGIPSFQQTIKNRNILSNADTLITALNYARIEAIKRGANVYLSPADYSPSPPPQPDWSKGIVVWFDNNNDDKLDTDEILRQWEALPKANSIVSKNNITLFEFKPSGEVNDGDLTLCDDRTKEIGRKITLLASGLIAETETTCA